MSENEQFRYADFAEWGRISVGPFTEFMLNKIL